MKSFFALFLAVLLGTGCTRPELHGHRNGRMASRRPLVGAYVRAGDLFAATDIDGRYEIVLPSGKRDITFSYIGYAARVVSTT